MKLTEDNFQLYAIKNYIPHGALSQEEFEDDLKIFTYIKKQLSKGDYNTHLVLNHIITIFNVFDQAALYMLFYKIDKKHWNDLITFLIFLNRMPERVPEYEIIRSDYSLNTQLISELRDI